MEVSPKEKWSTHCKTSWFWVHQCNLGAIINITKDQANLATNVVNALKEKKLAITKLQKKVDQTATTTTLSLLPAQLSAQLCQEKD